MKNEGKNLIRVVSKKTGNKGKWHATSFGAGGEFTACGMAEPEIGVENHTLDPTLQENEQGHDGLAYRESKTGGSITCPYCLDHIRFAKSWNI